LRRRVKPRGSALSQAFFCITDIFAKLGIVPSLLRTLSAHATLAQQAQDTETIYDAMEYLLRCRKEYDSLVSLADEGRLSEAAEASTRLQRLLDGAPPELTEAEVFAHLKVRLVQYSAFRKRLNMWPFLI
jgi:centromere/kinetochore protein ZW10